MGGRLVIEASQPFQTDISQAATDMTTYSWCEAALGRLPQLRGVLERSGELLPKGHLHWPRRGGHLPTVYYFSCQLHQQDPGWRAR